MAFELSEDVGDVKDGVVCYPLSVGAWTLVGRFPRWEGRCKEGKCTDRRPSTTRHGRHVTCGVNVIFNGKERNWTNRILVTHDSIHLFSAVSMQSFSLSPSHGHSGSLGPPQRAQLGV